MAALTFGDFRVHALPSAVPMRCGMCKEPRAHWVVHNTAGTGRQAVCGDCVLYETPWGQAHAEEIAGYIGRANEARRAGHSREFELVEGRVESDGADVVVGGVYMATQHQERLRRAMGSER